MKRYKKIENMKKIVGLDKSKLNAFGDTVGPSSKKASVVELGTIFGEDVQP